MTPRIPSGRMPVMLIVWYLLCAAPAAAAAEPDAIAPLHIMRVSAPDKDAWGRLFGMGLDIPEQVPGPELMIVGTDAEKQWLEAQGYSVDYELRDATRYFATRALAAGATTMGGFRTLSEIWSAVDSLVIGYPHVVSALQNIGLTHEGRPIYAVRISDHPNSDEGEPAVLITGLHHAREPIGPHIVIYTMQQLVENYGTDTMITRLVNEREIWFIPVVNPDGYAFNEAIAPSGGGMWRKNRRNSGGGAYGVDINRNYGYAWGWDNVGSSPDPTDDTYRGPAAFSEPETRAVRDFIIAHPNIRIAFNYHSYSNLLLWPWGYFNGYTPDNALFASIGDSATTWNNYVPIPGWMLYLTNGDSDDWGYGERGVLSYTPEVGSSQDYFWPDPGRIAPLTLENYPANLFIIGLADAPERMLLPGPPVWDSIAVVGEDSLGLFWHSADTSINAPVSYDVVELLGVRQEMDGFEAGFSSWYLDGFLPSTTQTFAGSYSLYSTTGDQLNTIARMAESLHPRHGDTLRFWASYDIEDGWDYAYVEISTNGGLTWAPTYGNITTMDNPHGSNIGHGITGNSGGWTPAWFDLSDFAGQDVLVRFRYVTDGFVYGGGFYADNVSPVTMFDSVSTALTTPDTSAILPGHPEGAYYFRLTARDAQGQSARSATLAFEYSTTPPYITGDTNASGAITSVDIIYLVNHLFKAGPAPLPVWQAGDCNASGSLTSADIVYLVNFVFKGGPPPIQP